MPRHNTTTVVVQDVRNDRTIGWLQWRNIAGPCTRKKRLQRKMTKDYYWIGVQENIGMFSKSYGDRNSLISPLLLERPARPVFIKLSYSCDMDDRKLFFELASTC